MTFAAKIVADSISPAGVRLTTMEITFPRIILAEFNTHRMLSRNSASSRAIPIEKMMRMVMDNPYIPSSWPKNQKGMSAEEDLSERDAEMAKQLWLEARSDATWKAGMLLERGVHKQITNRLLEPFMWHTCIVTATEWSNFFHLRCHPAAHPEIQRIATMMRELYEAPLHPGSNVEIKRLGHGQWHTPYIQEADLRWVEEVADLPQGRVPPGWHEHRRRQLCKISIGRCARVSYLTHDGKRDPQADIDLFDKLLASGHMSPFEHVARPATEDDDVFGMCKTNEYGRSGPDGQWFGNFRGWVQYRKTIPNEHDILGTSLGARSEP